MSTFRDKLKVKLATVEDLPTLPSILTELERLLHSESSGVAEIALVIEEDPGIAGGVLRVANSVMFYSSMSGTIVSVRDAIVRLGLKEVGQLVSSAALIRTFKTTGSHLNPKRFWRRSLCTAVAGRVIARAARSSKSFAEEEAYMAGLLHDLGFLILDQYFPDDYEQLHAAFESKGADSADIERDILGIDHGEIGGYLLDLWNLPMPLVHAVTWHNQPENAVPETRLLTETVRTSELITEILEAENAADERMQTLLDRELWAELCIPTEDVASIVAETKKDSTPVFALV
ncbi:MAG TPA: HDOD domain-containing protein [Candidatus Hydrogenedentes bacterium]|nr:HDOD domain-containing protein [Candidatus Hydrogenedentota bacterium]